MQSLVPPRMATMFLVSGALFNSGSTVDVAALVIAGICLPSTATLSMCQRGGNAMAALYGT
jgi:hypothetical protein